jgi:hypothetical protein
MSLLPNEERSKLTLAELKPEQDSLSQIDRELDLQAV